MADKGDNMVARVRITLDVPFSAPMDDEPSEKQRKEAARAADKVAKSLGSEIEGVVAVLVEEVRDL